MYIHIDGTTDIRMIRIYAKTIDYGGWDVI